MAYTDVDYTKVGWLNTPSTSTPINATNLGNMEDGIEACANRANASIPFDNILSLAEAQATSVRGTYVMDAVDSAVIANRIGENTITYEASEDAYYIQGSGAGVKKKLLNHGIINLGKVTYKENTITVASNLRSKITANNLFIQDTKLHLMCWYASTMSISPSISYNQSTGVITVNNMKSTTDDYVMLEEAYVYAFI